MSQKAFAALLPAVAAVLAIAFTGVVWAQQIDPPSGAPLTTSVPAQSAPAKPAEPMVAPIQRVKPALATLDPRLSAVPAKNGKTGIATRAKAKTDLAAAQLVKRVQPKSSLTPAAKSATKSAVIKPGGRVPVTTAPKAGTKATAGQGASPKRPVIAAKPV